jgi:mono/diheme cytochrome c family protein
MIKKILLLGSVILLAACSQESSSVAQAAPATLQKISPDTPEKISVPPRANFSQVARGGKIFQGNCASCHGAQAQGEPNWRQPGADGLNPAPPLDGTGHAWHHPKNMLMRTIKYGTPGGKGRMQPWGDKLSDQEIEDVTAWLISKWPKEIYSAWYQRTKGL